MDICEGTGNKVRQKGKIHIHQRTKMQHSVCHRMSTDQSVDGSDHLHKDFCGSSEIRSNPDVDTTNWLFGSTD